MKNNQLVFKLFSVILFILLTCISESSAQKIDICIDFSSSDTYLNKDGNQNQISPSAFSAADKAAIIAQVKSTYEAVVGKGNVVVKDAVDTCGPDSKLVYVSGSVGPGNEYGDANINDGVAAVFVAVYKLLN